jgi:gamma-tubulin complex component 2
MGEEFRIQHIASLMQKSLKTTYKADLIARDFFENKTPFLTAQVNTHNAVREIAEKTSTPREFVGLHEELKARNIRILSGWTSIIQKILKSRQLHAFTNAHSEYIGKSSKIRRNPPIEMAITIKEEIIDDKENRMSVENVDEFSNMLNSSIESGKKKIKSGAADSKHLTLSTETILDVNLQELTAYKFYIRNYLSKYNKQNSGPSLRQPDWWNIDFELAPTTHIPGKLESLPEEMQETLIVEDLLSLLMGGKAAHFKREIKETQKTTNFLLNFPDYVIDDKCDLSLKCLTTDPLRLVHCLDVIRSFVANRSDFHFGYLSHALAAELDCYIQEIYGQIQDFEESISRKINLVDSIRPLQQMANFVRPIFNQTVIVKDLCIELFKSNARGATILTIIHEKAVNSAGHAAAQHILYFLTRETSKPYLDMITGWIQKGVLKDDHNEFMINAREELGKEKLQNVYNDSYWEQHYSIVRERIPRFLEPFAEKILNTGKYLNVIRECGISVQTPPGVNELKYNMGPNCVRLFEAPIDHCYKFAAKILVDLLMKEHDLISRLKSMKRFFLLDQGDFLIQFIDLADDELKMPVSDITSSRLEALLDISIRTSAADKDPHKEDLKVVLSDKDLITELMSVILIESKEEDTLRRVNPHDVGLSGMEALSFDYVVKWPISLVISRKKIVHYQLLFRFLFYTKHIERIINNVWRSSAQLSKVQSIN